MDLHNTWADSRTLPQGAILLPKGFRFNTEVVKKLQDFMSRGNVRLSAQVLCKSIEAPKPGAKAAVTAAARPAPARAVS